MVIPFFSDLGKHAKQIFNKGFIGDLVKLDLKTKTTTDIEFKSTGSINRETAQLLGSLETKYKIKKYGFTIAEKWSSNDTLITEVSAPCQFVNNLNLLSSITYSPKSAKKSIQLNAAYHNNVAAINGNIDLSKDGASLQTSVVIGCEGWLVGYEAAFNTKSSKLTKSNIAIGFTYADLAIHTSISSRRDINGSIYQRISPTLEAAFQMSWLTSSNNLIFGIGTKYDIDKNISLRAKINNVSQIGFGYQQRVSDDISLTISTVVDGSNFNGGSHKIGISLDLQI